MRRPRSRSRLGGICAVSVAIVLAGCHSSGAGTHSSSPGPVRVSKGGTVSMGLPATPNWIFPFLSISHETVQNTFYFIDLMYRPLYWFGQVENPSPTLDERFSLAYAPVSPNGGRTVVIRLKGWRFSNGQRVDAESVIFWMNMLEAEPSQWAISLEPEFPYNVVSYAAPDGPRGEIVTITFDRRFSTLWLLYNELSQITPMPEAWDITSLHGAPGSGRCGLVTAGAMNGSVTKSACTRVWAFDTDNGGASTSPQMSGNLDTYTSNPLWQVVDGPWRLSNYDVSNGEVTFVPNPDYSGPQKPIISRFVELFYPSDAAVLAALARGGPGTPDIASISSQDLPVNTGPPGTTGDNVPQLAGRFTVDLADQWGISYAPENFDSTGDRGVVGALFRQLYIRQALQLLVDQPELIRTAARGYGVPVYGPVPAFPRSTFLTVQETVNPYRYNPERAVLLLREHGWRIFPEGADLCTRPGTAPGDCGKGIRRGSELKFTVLYNNGNTWILQVTLAEASAWAKAGIEAETQGESGTVVCSIDPAFRCGTAVGSWGVASFGGWFYIPDDSLPTGEELFVKSSPNNFGRYDDPTADRLIAETLASNRLGTLFEYENYLAEQLPVVWQPNDSVRPFEVSRNLGGVAPINSLETLTPEYWYWKTPNRS